MKHIISAHYHEISHQTKGAEADTEVTKLNLV
jgi:hypothetical protein